MSAPEIRPSAAQPERLHPTPLATPQKRKLSTAANHNGHEQQQPPMAQHNIQQPAPLAVPEPTRQYGVYMHTDHSDSPKEPQLINMAADWNSAYDAMRAHASDQLEKKPSWGATREIVTNNVYEILDSSHIVRLRYDIDTIVSAGIDAKDATIWKREKDWLAQNYANAPPVHYGMYVSRNCDDASKTEQFFIGGFKSFGEANHAMKTSAQAYLQAHSGAKLMERSVELVGEKGEVRQRYVIEQGRWQDGRFVKEEDWLGKQTDFHNGNMSPPPHKPVLDPNIEATATTKPIIHRTPPLRSPVRQAAPQPQPQQPAGLVHDPTPWCTCRQPDDGRLMVLCENEECPIQWYHGSCVNVHGELSEEEQWYCPQCAPAKEPKRKVVVAKTQDKDLKKRRTN